MTWITFEDAGLSASGKTRRWLVRPKEQPGALLGTVSWYGAWRKYAFEPFPKTIFEATCLRNIADFCEARTKEHKARVKNGKPQTTT